MRAVGQIGLLMAPKQRLPAVKKIKFQNEDVLPKTVVMTTPSLNPNANVSGISSVVSGLIFASQHPGLAFDWMISPAIVGKRDRQGRGVLWLVSQIAVLINFFSLIRRTRPTIVHINGPLSALAILRDWALIRMAKFFELAVIYHLHGGTFVHDGPPSGLIRRIALASLDEASVIIVLSDLEASSIARIYNTNPDKIRVLRNAVRTANECPVKPTGGRLRVLSIGRLSPEKGLSVLCDAIEADPDLRDQLQIRMHGAGDLEAEITSRLAASLGDAFSFEGVAGGKKKSEAYAWADVVIMPSLREGLPMVLLESMASGVVPITTSVGSISEVIRDRSNGVMIEKGSPQSLTLGLHQAVEMKKTGVLHDLAMNAHRTVQETYSLPKQVQLLGQIYTEIIRGATAK